MKYFCTLSDSKYIVQGLAMYNSLLTHCVEDFILYYLCLDKESYHVITKHNFKKIKPLLITDIEDRDVTLQNAKKIIKPELGGNNNNMYCWGLASYFCQYLLENEKISDILYIDSDIMFYNDLRPIYNEIGNKSCGIIKHRHNIVGNIDGAYNVGIIWFKNNETGKNILKWWIDGVWFGKHKEYATCGDQKFLEGFIPNFGIENICVIDETVGHGAPWNYRLYCYDKFDSQGKIGYGNNEQTFVFNHFSRIRIKNINEPWPTNLLDFTGGNYPEHTLNFQIFEMPQIRKLYTDYVHILKQIKAKIG